MEMDEKPDVTPKAAGKSPKRGWSRMLKPVLGREEQELQQLMARDTVRTNPRHSTPDIIRPTTCNKMLAFNLPEARKREVHEYLEECALRAKVKLMVAHMKEMALAVEEEEEEEREPTPAPEYEIILKRFADIDPPPISQAWIDNIYKILTPKVVHKHSNLIKQIIEEVKEEYKATLLKLSVYMKFGSVLGEPNLQFLLPLKPDVGGKTPNYDRYIAFRRVIQNELFLTHPLIRKILSSSKLAIPDVLVNFKNYRKRGWLHLDKLLSLITSDMKKAEHQICKNWYPKLINMISVKNSLETVPMVLWPRFVRCASTVVSVQITQLMQRTICHIIETLSDINTFPQLNLDAYYSGSNVAMIPSEDEIFISFHRIIDTISYMAQDMPAMEAWFSVPCPNKFIVVKRSESFLRASHQALEDNLYELFTPVRNYLQALGEEFSGLCSEDKQQEIQRFIKEPHAYEEMFEKVSYLKMYSRKVKKMVFKEYFTVFRLSQSDVITHLNKVANGFMSQILLEISAQQINENKKICSEFEMVAERTLHMPVKTKELVAMGSYIKYCRTTFMERVKSRILGSIQLAIQLMDFTSLTEEQIHLNARVVNWLNKIKPIFQEYNDLFENTKYELEERLQRSTEKLNKELEDVGPSLSSLSNMDDVNKIAEYVQFIQKFLRRLEQFDGVVSWINNEEVLFKFPISTYPELDELKSIVHPFAKLIFTCCKWFRTYKIWMDGAFDELILEAVEEQVSFFFQDLTATQKSYKTKCKQQATDNYPRRFKGTVDDPDVNNWPAPLKLCSQTLNHINEFKQNLRLIGIVCNSALRKRHWEDLSEIAGFDVTPDAGTTLRKFIGYHLEHLLDPFEVVSVSACKELHLYQTLCAMKVEWTNVYFTSTPYLDTKTEILCDVEDILTLVDNHLIKCVSIRGSAFVKPLIGEVKEWCERLERVNLAIETWLKVERQWMDFHPIFTCETARDCMDKEVLLFQEVDQMYRELMKETSQGSQVIKTAGEPPLLEKVLHMFGIMENINAGVKVYLNQLQMYFPRLFFLSDFEILQILAESKSTDVIHIHLKKLFIGVQDLCYDNNEVVAMQSSDGEKIMFEQPLATQEYSGCVEKLLFDVEKQMQASMKVQCKRCLTMYKKEGFREWIVGWPAQAVQCALVTIRTGQIQNCLSQQKLDQLHFVNNNIQNQKEVMFSLVQGSLMPRVRTAVEALIILTIHVLELLQLIFAEKIISESDFNWLVQLRYYQEEIVKIRMLNSVLPYGYEYLGNTSRLVVTPLTERCFRTLLTAYHMNLHGAPEGPPGTGKSETVGDLAKAVGVYCFSFCCTPGLSHVAIGKFLQGIAGCGAWGCLNNFHQMKLEVLSVVAQQLDSIASIIKSERPTNSPHCYICVTLLPGISVHSPIPANLKMLFRPVAMMLPDTMTIAEVYLYSFGFTQSHALALKLVSLQKLCSKQSSQHARFCYDFGSLKSVLQVAKHFKHNQKNWSESDVLLTAIMDTLMPKLSDDNIQVLNSVLADLFPDHILVSSAVHHTMKSSAIQVCQGLKLKASDVFVSKIIQIHEALKLYTGVILLGDPFSGKSSALKVVRNILKSPSEELISPVNPKTLSLSQMYGYIHPESNEWLDGIIPKFFRESNNKQWLVLDGPMESSWLDTLNTAFDMSRKLCLSSGEIIPVSPNISVIFETMNLDEVSPATMSRCGVVYLPPDTIGWRGLVHHWLSSARDFQSNYTSNYHTLFDWIVPPTLAFVEGKCSFVMKAGRYNMVRTMLLLIEMMLKYACADNEDFAKHLPVWIQSSTLLAGVWAFGGPLMPDSREQFDIFFRDIWRGNIENHPMPETIEKLEINIPSEGQLNDYWYHFKGKGAWRFWPEVVRSLKIEEEAPNLQFTLVSTIESAKYLNILDMHVKHHSPVLLVGPTASGKTLYFSKTINKLSLEKFLPINISFSPFSSAHFFQDYVISKLQRRSQARYAAPGGRVAVLMVEDVNMAPTPPLEVIHHYLDHHQWFRTKDNSKVAIEDLLLFSACGIPGGHKKHISPRILRHFSFFALSPLMDETISKIYSTLLFTGFKRNGFATDVMPTVTCIVAATADILQWITQTLRPTPSKPHYAFTLWDYARLIHSHLLVKRENIDNKKVFIRLWVHEALRVFNDRLIEPQDRALLIQRMRYAVKECFKESFDVSLDNLMPKEQEEINEDNLRNLIFTTALTSENEDMKYEEVGSLDQFLKALAPIIENYNSTQDVKLNIVLFRFALEHLSRLCRVLSINGGSCLMLGMRGSGRQTITQLAALLCKASFHQPSVVHNYGFSEWRMDLKQVLVSAGGHNTKTVFFVSENELTNDTFLQDIDMVLSSGQVPDMFSSSELEEIFDMVRLSAQGGNRNLDINPLTVFAFFVSRCRQNMHIILSLSSISYSFRRWLSLYPSLLNFCTVDWVEPYKTMTFNGKEYKLKDWPEEALEKIAFHYWEGIEMEETVLGSAVKLCKYIHVTAREITEKFYSVTGRKCYVTSASYLMMVKKYRHLVVRKQEEIVNAKAQFITGLEKLEYASKQVSVMQEELEALQPQLQVAAAETEKMMEVIERETVVIEQASALVREDEKVAKVQAAAANNLKTECEADLALAIPILEEAVAALNTLKPTDITLVKSMKNPPDTVKLVMAAVCVMKDIKPEKIPDPNTPGRKILDYWGPSKRLLGDMAFLQQLKDYDKDNIPPPIMAMIRKQYLPNKDFKPHIVAKASSAAEGLCKWVIAMDMYDAVAKEVAPKKAKLEIAEREFAATMAILEEKRAQVRMLEEKLMDLNAKLDAAQQRKKVLEDEVGMCENKLWKAQKLIGGLGGEKGRWTETVDALQTCYDNLAGDMLLSCGVIAYLAPLTSQFRQSLLNDWCLICSELNIPKSETFSFVKVLGFDINIQNWTIFGLPRDEFSIENAVILENTVRCPLLIDPQGHANRWIKSKEKANKLQVLRLSDEDYMKSVEISMNNGNPVLLENVEEDLNVILLSPLFVRRSIPPGGQKIPCIYITTRLQNPAFSPTVFNIFSVINFTLTLNGLEDKLLDIVIAKERPDLQEKKQAMIISSSENKMKLQQVESRILDTLSYTKGNILENEAAIEILDTAKALSNEIKEKQMLAKIIEEEIHAYCKLYFAVVEHSARLYFCLTNLVYINYMYQFSLDWFLKTYVTSIDTANKSQVMEVRLQYLENRITYNLYQNVCCSLFEKHRILYSLLLCTTIELAKMTILEEDLNFFMGMKDQNDEICETDSPHDWISSSAWRQLRRLDKLPSYSGILESISNDSLKWKALQNSDRMKFPDTWDSQLSNFQKLNVIKIIYPDKMRDRIVEYVESCMGQQYASPPSLDLTSSFDDSNCLTPLLFIICPGSDPAATLLQFAKKKLFQNRLYAISLGVNQGEAASRLISRCQEEGSWALLQNCHLAPEYMPCLDRLCGNLSLHNTSMEFRLWLTSAPSTQFPVSILQSSVKITTDLPPGLKRRLRHSFESEPIIVEEFFYGCPGKDRAFAKLLYSLCFLHALVQERKKYGHSGWNILYEFYDVDFNMSLQQLQMYINEYKDIPYNMIKYVVGECNYGGRVQDEVDHRLLRTVMDDIVNPRVVETLNYQLSSVTVPLRFEYHDFLLAIQELPDNATAEVFGLNFNAEIKYNLEITKELFENLELLQPTSSKRKLTHKQSTLSLVESIIAKLPEELSLEAKYEFPSSGLGFVLRQEHMLYARLISTVRTSLHSFSNAFLGLSEMSEDIELFGFQVEKGLVPSAWLKVSYLTCKSLGSYVDDLVDRLKYIKVCCSEGVGTEVWLGGLFQPEALLVSALHDYSRAVNIPFHQLCWDHHVLPPSDASTTGPGLVVYGLYIQGASWNPSVSMLEEQPLRVLTSKLPKIKFNPIVRSERKEESRYKSPVYGTATRGDYVTEVFLNSDLPPSHWIYRGVVLLCQSET